MDRTDLTEAEAADAHVVAGWLADAVPVQGGRALMIGLDFLRDPIMATERCHQRFGPAVDLSFRGLGRRTRRTLLLGPSYNRAVLARPDLARPAGLWSVPGPPGSAQAEMRHNYLATSGAEHARLARCVVPHLGGERVAGHFEATKSAVLDGVAAWTADRPVDLYGLIRRIGQHVGLGLLFGEPDHAAAERFGAMLAEYHADNWRPAARLTLPIPGLPYQNLLDRAERLRDFVRDWVGERSGCPIHQDLRAALAGHRNGSGQPLTPERLTAHVNFVGFAAYETMSSALTWTLYLLALHPEVLADLVDELSIAPIETASAEALDGLPLLDWVVKESLRLIPPTPVLPWRTVRRWPLDGAKAKVSVLLNPHLSHRDPDLFPEPRRFLPSRWATAQPGPYQYLPFSAGPRRCPGYAFGTQFMKVGLAGVLSRWRVELRPGMRVDRVYRGITMPRPGMTVRLHPADRRYPSVEVRGNIHDLVALQ